jgi:hypothetical protein
MEHGYPQPVIKTQKDAASPFPNPVGVIDTPHAAAMARCLSGTFGLGSSDASGVGIWIMFPKVWRGVEQPGSSSGS